MACEIIEFPKNPSVADLVIAILNNERRRRGDHCRLAAGLIACASAILAREAGVDEALRVLDLAARALPPRS